MKSLIFYKPLVDTEVCEFASMGYWTSEEAVLLSMGLSINNAFNCDEIDVEEAKERGQELKRRGDILRRSYSAELPDIRCPYTTRPNLDSIYLGEKSNSYNVHHPAKFTLWAKKAYASFPDVLYYAVRELYPQEFPNEEESRKPKNNQFARERCRAIAELLWHQDQTIKTKDMQVRPEIMEFGLGKFYEVSTIYDWIHDLSPKSKKRVKNKQVK